jgi:Xaa-Pro aminopeptidase
VIFTEDECSQSSIVEAHLAQAISGGNHLSTQLSSDEGGLDALLRRSGARIGVTGVRDLVAGVAAAPVGFDPESWMLLIADQPSMEARAALSALLVHARQRLRPQGTGDHSARLAALRVQMRRKGLAGFVVPRNDEHQGEYVAARSERLAWLTGFTGSAGTAVVLSEGAALFVDGRYTTQAGNEVDTTLFAIRHVIEQPLTEWLARELPANARVGYDPWLHTPNQVAAFERACVQAGGQAVPVDGNLIDRIWLDQPPRPIAPVVPYDDELAGQSSREKRERIAEALRKEKHDAVFLAQPDSIAWLLNIRGGDVPYSPLPLAFAVLHADARVDLFIDRRKMTSAASAHLRNGVTVTPPEALPDALDRLGGSYRKVRIDPDRTPEWVSRHLNAKGAVIAQAADPCLLPKATKSARELAGMRAAHVRDGAALTRFLAWLSTAALDSGLSESAAAERLAAFRAENERYRGPSFPTISAAGSNAAIIHYRVSPESDRLLTRDTLYLVDSGAQYLDGTTDVTRTVALGEPTTEMRQRFTLVLKGHIAIATARFPRGTTGSQLDALARQAMWRAGLDYDHGTGHGVGYYLGVHEGPQRISKLPNPVPLRPGMIVSNEPGYYKPGAYGIRIENLVAVTQVETPTGGEQELFGFETLTLAPIDLALIDSSLLDEKEMEWLDAYHARVRETLTPLVDRETQLWLEAVTRPMSGSRQQGPIA